MKQHEDAIRPGSMTLGSGARQTPVRGTVHSDVWIPLLQALVSAVLVGLFAVGAELLFRDNAAGGLLAGAAALLALCAALTRSRYPARRWALALGVAALAPSAGSAYCVALYGGDPAGALLVVTTLPASLVWYWRLRGMRPVVWEREQWHTEPAAPPAQAEPAGRTTPRLVAVNRGYMTEDDREDADWGKFVWLGFTHGLNFHADSRGVGGLEGRVLPSGDKITYSLWGHYRSELERVGLIRKDRKGKAVFTFGYDETMDRLQVRDKWRPPAPRGNVATVVTAPATDETDETVG